MRTTRPSASSREAIARVVNRGRGRIQRCFERELLVGGKRVDGRILVRWRIGPRGRPTAPVVVADSVNSPTIARCVLETISGWRFPPPSQPIAVVFPFEFFVNS